MSYRRTHEPGLIMPPSWWERHEQLLHETMLLSEAATRYGVTVNALTYQLKTAWYWPTQRGRRYRIDDIERAVAVIQRKRQG